MGIGHVKIKEKNERKITIKNFKKGELYKTLRQDKAIGGDQKTY